MNANVSLLFTLLTRELRATGAAVPEDPAAFASTLATCVEVNDRAQGDAPGPVAVALEQLSQSLRATPFDLSATTDDRDGLTIAFQSMRNYYEEGIDEEDEQEVRLHEVARSWLTAQPAVRRTGTPATPECVSALEGLCATLRHTPIGLQTQLALNRADQALALQRKESAAPERESVPAGESLAMVCCGAPFENQTFVGPFPTFDDASEWADASEHQHTWIMGLSSPCHAGQSAAGVDLEPVSDAYPLHLCGGENADHDGAQCLMASDGNTWMAEIIPGAGGEDLQERIMAALNYTAHISTRDLVVATRRL
ncbi:MAG: hypothetical protein A2580_11745 [Hydrogenophilales bacterium RIFOXYD1_FULL_62_11]|nr:MAG: hypothetical protein A2580_11745 [Hydrogenophilales bacterium RIFOXYD1_FULL_62_11]